MDIIFTYLIKLLFWVVVERFNLVIFSTIMILIFIVYPVNATVCKVKVASS